MRKRTSHMHLLVIHVSHASTIRAVCTAGPWKRQKRNISDTGKTLIRYRHNTGEIQVRSTYLIQKAEFRDIPKYELY